MLVGIMNHRGKNGRNHEYQDSNDSASTPEYSSFIPQITLECFSLNDTKIAKLPCYYGRQRGSISTHIGSMSSP